MYTANSDKTPPTEPPIEVSRHFIRAQEDYSVHTSIANNINSELMGMDGTSRFFIQQNNTSEACLANLEGIESETNLFSVKGCVINEDGLVVLLPQPNAWQILEFQALPRA